MECPEHGSQKNTQQCAFLPAQRDALCARLQSMSGMLGGYVSKALWAADGQKMISEQQAVLFAAVADALSWLLMSHLPNMYFQ